MSHIKQYSKDTTWCRFESNYYDNRINQWVPKNDGLRRCLHSKCDRKHRLKNRPTKVCKRETDCPDVGVTCFLLHNISEIKPMCYFDKNCCDLNCTSIRHSSNRTTEVCEFGEKCKNALITCFKLHPLDKMVPLCKYRSECKNFICEKRHPNDRKKLCEDGSMCYNFIVNGINGCDFLHPKILQKLCHWDSTEQKCRSYGCPYVHNDNSPKDCENGMNCQFRLSEDDNKCEKKHPKYTFLKKLSDGSMYFE